MTVDSPERPCMLDQMPDHLLRLIAQAEAAFASFSAERWYASRGAGKWTPVQVLGHLIDSAANNHQRFVRAQFTWPFVWPGYDQQTWVPLHHYRDRPWTEVVDLWVALNRHVAAVIEFVPVEKLQTPCTIGDRPTIPTS